MKILVTGGKGQLANEIKSILTTGKSEIGGSPVDINKCDATYIDIEELDITKISDVKKYVSNLKPDVIINCAAFTNVDGCETNKDAAFKVNALGPRNLAMAAEEIGAKLIHVSTDYVFSGEVRNESLKEYDEVGPQSVYGTTKRLGEEYVKEFCSKYYIVRTAWLYGYIGNNFVYTMRKLGRSHDAITVVNDQRGNPTNANDLAYHLLKLINTEEYGIYHCTGEGECSWYDFAKKIMELSQLNCTVKAVDSEEYAKNAGKTVAKRPFYSSLDNMMLRATVGNEMRNWEDAIETFINNIPKYNIDK